MSAVYATQSVIVSYGSLSRMRQGENLFAFLKDFIYFFLERGEGREKEGE